MQGKLRLGHLEGLTKATSKKPAKSAISLPNSMLHPPASEKRDSSPRPSRGAQAAAGLCEAGILFGSTSLGCLPSPSATLTMLEALTLRF